MSGDQIYNFIKPHLGSIFPQGEHSIDTDRLKNIEIYNDLINRLITDLQRTIEISDCHSELSIKKLGASATTVLEEEYDHIKWILGGLNGTD